MYSTYELLNKQIGETKLRGLSNEQLVRMYKEHPSQRIISSLYCNNFGVLRLLANSFSIIEEEDRASLILEKIAEAAVSYSEKGGSKFITYLTKLVSNQLGWYIDNYLDAKGRTTELNSIEFHDESSDTVEEIVADDSTLKRLRQFELEETLRRCGLTKRQYAICLIYLRYGNLTLDDVADILHTTWSIVSQEKTRIREKLTFLKDPNYQAEVAL